MKVILSILMLFPIAGAYGAPRLQRQQTKQQNRLQPKRVNPDRPLPRRALLEESVLGFYVKQFQQAAEVSPEVFAKILPFLEQFVEDRFEISQRRTRALNQMRQAVNRGGSDEDLRSTIREVDSADEEFQANQAKFLSAVDPLLSTRQQARLRIFMVGADNRLRQILNTVQNGNQQRQNAAPPN